LSTTASELLDEPTAAQLAAYLDLDAPPERADLAFVFGTRHAQPACLAADLFRRGIVEWILLTGGSNRLTDLPEAQAHLEIVLGEGVPRERVIVESASTNTLENVVLALPLLQERGLLQRLRSVVAVCKWYHCRRAVMTLKAHLPNGVRYYTQTYEPDDLCRAGWQHHPQSARRVIKEWQAIPRYLSQGDIAEVCFDGQAFV
jgi:uncharacterized SAM-binding protein YcdF (DUF218 family)